MPTPKILITYNGNPVEFVRSIAEQMRQKIVEGIRLQIYSDKINDIPQVLPDVAAFMRGLGFVDRIVKLPRELWFRVIKNTTLDNLQEFIVTQVRTISDGYYILELGNDKSNTITLDDSFSVDEYAFGGCSFQVAKDLVEEGISPAGTNLVFTEIECECGANPYVADTDLDLAFAFPTRFVLEIDGEYWPCNKRRFHAEAECDSGSTRFLTIGSPKSITDMMFADVFDGVYLDTAFESGSGYDSLEALAKDYPDYFNHVGLEATKRNSIRVF